MALLADTILYLHFAYVLAVVLPVALIPIGALRGWKWVRSWRLRALHVGMMGFVLFEVFIGMTCPLTDLENWLLRSSGREGYSQSFIAHWISRIMYHEALPPWFFTIGYATFFGVIALEWYYVRPYVRISKKFPPGSKK